MVYIKFIFKSVKDVKLCLISNYIDCVAIPLAKCKKDYAILLIVLLQSSTLVTCEISTRHKRR